MKTNTTTNSYLALLGTLFAAVAPSCAQEAPAPPAENANPPAAAPAEKPKPKKEDPTVAVSRIGVKLGGTSTWQGTHEDYVKRAKEGKVNLVFFGDSLTHWWDWQDFRKRYQKLGGVNFGIGGDKTQHLQWRIRNGELDGITPKVAVVLIGTNNLGDDAPDKVAEGITRVVEAIRETSPTTKVLLFGLFPRGWDANQVKWYDGKISKINATLAKLDNGDTIRYADFGPQLREPDGGVSREIFKDGLHLSGKGYARWADLMQPLLDEMLGLPKTDLIPLDAPVVPAPAAQ